MKRVLNKKIILINLVVLIIISSSVLISAAPIDTIIETIRDFFNNPGFTGENFKLYSAQILFLLLVTLIIFAISDFIPFLEQSHEFLRFGVSLIIGLLSTMYLTSDEIYTALLGYEALGIVLTTIIPFVVLLTVTIRWNVRYPEYSFLSTFAWIAYLVAYFIKYAQEVWLWLTTGQSKIEGFGILFVLITGIVSVIMAIAGGYITRIYFRRRMKGLIAKAEIRSEAERTGMIAQLERWKNVNPEDSDIYDQEIKKLKKLRFRI